METIKEAAFEDGERIEREQIETEGKADSEYFLEILAYDPQRPAAFRVGRISRERYGELLTLLESRDAL